MTGHGEEGEASERRGEGGIRALAATAGGDRVSYSSLDRFSLTSLCLPSSQVVSHCNRRSNPLALPRRRSSLGPSPTSSFHTSSSHRADQFNS